MTKEEAIEILEDLDGYFSDNQGKDYDEAFRMAIEALSAEPTIPIFAESAEAYKKWTGEDMGKTDLISRADVLKYPIRLDHYDEENGSREFVYGVESVIEYVESLPSADAVDCTDFIEWLVDRVLDETIWEYNSVAYGEIICRKLEKLGILEVTEEPSYYIRPSADAVQGEWEHWGSPFSDESEVIDTIVCSVCGARFIEPKDEPKGEYNFCPNCGARMKGGAE